MTEAQQRFFDEKFQFTHPRGVRWPARADYAQGRGFNSRTREGCDSCRDFACNGREVSIHAPARGAITAKKTLEWMF